MLQTLLLVLSVPVFFVLSAVSVFCALDMGVQGVFCLLSRHRLFEECDTSLFLTPRVHLYVLWAMLGTHLASNALALLFFAMMLVSRRASYVGLRLRKRFFSRVYLYHEGPLHLMVLALTVLSAAVYLLRLDQPLYSFLVPASLWMQNAVILFTSNLELSVPRAEHIQKRVEYAAVIEFEGKNNPNGFIRNRQLLQAVLVGTMTSLGIYNLVLCVYDLVAYVRDSQPAVTGDPEAIVLVLSILGRLLSAAYRWSVVTFCWKKAMLPYKNPLHEYEGWEVALEQSREQLETYDPDI